MQNKQGDIEEIRNALYPVKCPYCSTGQRPQTKICSSCGHPMDQPVERLNWWAFQCSAFRNSVESVASRLNELGLGSKASNFLATIIVSLGVALVSLIIISWTLMGWCGYDPWV